MAANSAASNLSRSSTVSLHLAASILNHLFALSHGRTTKQQGKGERIDANIFSIIPRRIGTKKFLWCPPPPSLSSAPISSAFSYSVRLEIDSHGCLAANVFPLVSLVPIQPETESPVPGYFWHSNNADLICTMPLRANRIAECSFPRVKVFPLRIPASCLLAKQTFLLLSFLPPLPPLFPQFLLQYLTSFVCFSMPLFIRFLHLTARSSLLQV